MNSLRSIYKSFTGQSSSSSSSAPPPQFSERPLVNIIQFEKKILLENYQSLKESNDLFDRMTNLSTIIPKEKENNLVLNIKNKIRILNSTYTSLDYYPVNINNFSLNVLSLLFIKCVENKEIVCRTRNTYVICDGQITKTGFGFYKKIEALKFEYENNLEDEKVAIQNCTTLSQYNLEEANIHKFNLLDDLYDLISTIKNVNDTILKFEDWKLSFIPQDDQACWIKGGRAIQALHPEKLIFTSNDYYEYWSNEYQKVISDQRLFDDSFLDFSPEASNEFPSAEEGLSLVNRDFLVPLIRDFTKELFVDRSEELANESEDLPCVNLGLLTPFGLHKCLTRICAFIGPKNLSELKGDSHIKFTEADYFNHIQKPDQVKTITDFFIKVTGIKKAEVVKRLGCRTTVWNYFKDSISFSDKGTSDDVLDIFFILFGITSIPIISDLISWLRNLNQTDIADFQKKLSEGQTKGLFNFEGLQNEFDFWTKNSILDQEQMFRALNGKHSSEYQKIFSSYLEHCEAIPSKLIKFLNPSSNSDKPEKKDERKIPEKSIINRTAKYFTDLGQSVTDRIIQKVSQIVHKSTFPVLRAILKRQFISPVISNTNFLKMVKSSSIKCSDRFINDCMEKLENTESLEKIWAGKIIDFCLSDDILSLIINGLSPLEEFLSLFSKAKGMDKELFIQEFTKIRGNTFSLIFNLLQIFLTKIDSDPDLATGLDSFLEEGRKFVTNLVNDAPNSRSTSQEICNNFFQEVVNPFFKKFLPIIDLELSY